MKQTWKTHIDGNNLKGYTSGRWITIRNPLSYVTFQRSYVGESTKHDGKRMQFFCAPIAQHPGHFHPKTLCMSMAFFSASIPRKASGLDQSRHPQIGLWKPRHLHRKLLPHHTLKTYAYRYFSKNRKPIKASTSIVCTLRGMEISSKRLQCLKAFFPMTVRDSGMMILSKEQHPSKAPCPMTVTKAGIFMRLRDSHPLKVSLEMQESTVHRLRCTPTNCSPGRQLLR